MLSKSQQLVVLLGAWALLALTILLLFGSLSITFYFTIAFLGFIILSALISPYTVKPAWKSRLNLVALAGLVLFCLAVVVKAIFILQEGI